MGFLTEHCSLRVLTRDILASCKPFVCENEDLNDYFRNDATLYQEQLLGKTYCYLWDDDPSSIVCAFTLSYDSIRVDHLPCSRKHNLNSKIPYPKRLRRYPAVLIGRLGVSSEFTDKGIGSELMDIIKIWFSLPDNKAACRFIAVDSYNTPHTIHYYLKNGFKFLFSTEEQEARNSMMRLPLDTRYMYFDLIEVFAFAAKQG